MVGTKIRWKIYAVDQALDYVNNNIHNLDDNQIKKNIFSLRSAQR